MFQQTGSSLIKSIVPTEMVSLRLCVSSPLTRRQFTGDDLVALTQKHKKPKSSCSGSLHDTRCRKPRSARRDHSGPDMCCSSRRRSSQQTIPPQLLFFPASVQHSVLSNSPRRCTSPWIQRISSLPGTCFTITRSLRISAARTSSILPADLKISLASSCFPRCKIRTEKKLSS